MEFSGTQRGSIASTLSGTLRKPSGSTLISLAGMLAERDSQQSAAMALGSAQSVRERRSSRGSSEDQRLQPATTSSDAASRPSLASHTQRSSSRDNRNSLGSAVFAADNCNNNSSSSSRHYRSSQSATAQRSSNSSNSNSNININIGNEEERRGLRERNRRRERERRDRMDRLEPLDQDRHSALKIDFPAGKVQVDQRVKVFISCMQFKFNDYENY